MFAIPHLCCHTQQSPEAVTEALWYTVTVVDVVEEAIASVCNAMEGVCVVLRSVPKRKDTSLTVDLTKKRPVIVNERSASTQFHADQFVGTTPIIKRHMIESHTTFGGRAISFCRYNITHTDSCFP